MKKKIIGILAGVALLLAVFVPVAGASNILPPKGRAAEVVIAASNSTFWDKLNADYVCSGTSSLSGTLVNGTGVATGSPVTLSSGSAITTTQAGTFTVTLAAGQTAIATSGTATVCIGSIANGTGTLQTSPTNIVSGTAVTVTGNGTFAVTLSSGQSASLAASGCSVSPTTIGSGASTITISGVSGTGTITFTSYSPPVQLSAGANTITTVGTGTIYISGMGDETVINKALSSIETTSGSGEVHLLAGSYNIASPIIIDGNGVTLSGVNMQSSRLDLDNGANCDIIQYTNTSATVPIYFCEVHDLLINGNDIGNNNLAGNGINLYQTPGDDSNNDFHVFNVFEMHCAGNGFYSQYSWGLMMTNCLWEYNGGYGVYFTEGSEGYLSGVFSSYNSLDGFNMSMNTTMMSECYAYMNTGSGFWIASGTGNNQLSNSLANDNGKWGIYLRTGDTQVSNSRAIDNAWHGFYVYSAGNQLSNCEADTNNTSNTGQDDFCIYASNNVLTGCVANGNASTPKPNAGFEVANNAANVQFMGCRAANQSTNKDYLIDSGCTGTILWGCVQADGYTDNGTSTNANPAL